MAYFIYENLFLGCRKEFLRLPGEFVVMQVVQEGTGMHYLLSIYITDNRGACARNDRERE